MCMVRTTIYLRAAVAGQPLAALFPPPSRACARRGREARPCTKVRILPFHLRSHHSEAHLQTLKKLKMPRCFHLTGVSARTSCLTTDGRYPLPCSTSALACKRKDGCARTFLSVFNKRSGCPNWFPTKVSHGNGNNTSTRITLIKMIPEIQPMDVECLHIIWH